MIRRQQKGWLGIDIGTSCVKVAQLARTDHGVRVLARSIVSRSANAGEENQEASTRPIWSAAAEIRAAVSLTSGFRGRQAAAMMPMGFCDVHQLSNLSIEDYDLDGMVRGAIETITQCSADHLEYDIWPTESGSAANSPRWNVLAVGRPWSDQVYYDLVESGLTCRTIDGTPHALARAVNLIADVQPLPPVGVLDWGFGQATFCIVVGQEPVYVRSLKDCSLERTLSAIADELGTTQDEAHLLLEKHGVRGQAAKSTDEVTNLIAELIAEPLRQLDSEIAKTISHIGLQRRAIAPQQLYLFGGGALIAGLARHLSRRLHLETHVWSLKDPHSDEARHDCLFGPAMSLSALAWEVA